MSEPIVSMSGAPEWHERAKRYNQRLVRLSEMKNSLREIEESNRRRRPGLFAPAPAATDASGYYREIDRMTQELVAERSEIVRNCENVKP